MRYRRRVEESAGRWWRGRKRATDGEEKRNLGEEKRFCGRGRSRPQERGAMYRSLTHYYSGCISLHCSGTLTHIHNCSLQWVSWPLLNKAGWEHLCGSQTDDLLHCCSRCSVVINIIIKTHISLSCALRHSDFSLQLFQWVLLSVMHTTDK